jgi:hypothetical protein
MRIRELWSSAIDESMIPSSQTRKEVDLDALDFACKASTPALSNKFRKTEHQP